MRAREFVAETASAGATGAGSVAVVSQPLGTIISRTQTVKPAKYLNSLKQGRKQQHVSR